MVWPGWCQSPDVFGAGGFGNFLVDAMYFSTSFSGASAAQPNSQHNRAAHTVPLVIGHDEQNVRPPNNCECTHKFILFLFMRLI
jgi:hypothetical protein